MRGAEPPPSLLLDHYLSPLRRQMRRDYERDQRLQSTASLHGELESLQFQREWYRARIDQAPHTVNYPEETLAYLDWRIADVEAELTDRERLMARNAELEQYRVRPGQRRTRLPIDATDLKRVWPIQAFAERAMSVDLGDGAHPKGRCPLPDHGESTPSFTVYPESDSWYCFGCNRGGDIFTLAALKLGLDPIHEFREVLRRVACATPHMIGGGP